MSNVIDFNFAKRQGEPLPGTVDADDIRERLHADARGFVEWLYSGRAFISRNEARIGDVFGTPGASLSIKLSGADAGLWKDHATDEGGDLISLYRAFMGYSGNADFVQSLKEIAKEYFRDPVDIERPSWRPTPTERIAQNKEKLGTKPRDDLIGLGPPVATYKYYDTRGNIIASVVRYQPDGTRENKTFRPYCFRIIDGVQKWVQGAPDLRPLYRLPEIALTSTVVLCEGEGKADALAQLGIEATSAMQGANAPIDKTDWSPLAGKTVIIWPDNDAPGFAYARNVAARLQSLGCTVLGITPPKDVPQGWDAVDAIADGLNVQEIIAGATLVNPEPGPEQPDDEPAEKPQPRSTLTFYDELDDDPPPKRWIIKGVIAHGETSNWFGPPGSLKSALMTDLAIHAASGQDWRGFRAKEHCGVLYLALERGAQVKRRLSAYRSKRGAAPDLPIAVKSEIIDLMHPDCVDQIIDMVREAEAHFRCNVGLIIVDTISKGIAASGGDENSAKETNIMLAKLRRVQERTGVHVACVGHTGKDESKGHRGSSAHMGDVDLMVQISGDAVKTATIIKANDQEEGRLTTWMTEVVNLGTDEDGDDITTALISNETPGVGKKTKAKLRLTDSQRRAMELLSRCINDHGRPPPPSNEFPQNVRIVSLKEWGVMCERDGLSSADKKEDRERAFRRAKDDLQTMHQIGCLDGLVWQVPSHLDFNGA
jgi:hypothetical protein